MHFWLFEKYYYYYFTMETMEAPTPIESEKFDKKDDTINQKDIRIFNIKHKDKVYKLELGKSENSKLIMFKISNPNDLIGKNFILKMDLEDFYELNKIFTFYTNIDEIYTSILNILTENKYKITVENSEILFILEFPIPGNKIIDINFVLAESKQNKNELINNIYSLVNKLLEENKAIKNDIKNLYIKQELMQEEINKKNNEIQNLKNELICLKNGNSESETYIDNVNHLDFQGFDESKILKNNDEKYQLYIWISQVGKIYEINLLYKASEDCGNEIFFKKWSDKGPTVSIIKSLKGRRFGGFIKENWKNSKKEIFIKDDNAFLFSLDNCQKYNVLIPEYAASCHPKCYSMVYGNKSDGGGLCIDNDANGPCCENLFNNVFDVPSKYCLSGEEKDFGIEECEVYQIIFMN